MKKGIAWFLAPLVFVGCAERVRFSKTGSDVTSAAIRIARATTGSRRGGGGCGKHRVGWCQTQRV